MVYEALSLVLFEYFIGGEKLIENRGLAVKFVRNQGSST